MLNRSSNFHYSVRQISRRILVSLFLVLVGCASLSTSKTVIPNPKPRENWLAPLYSKWEIESPKKKYSIHRVLTPSRSGSESLRFELRKGEKTFNHHGEPNYRSEISTHEYVRIGSEQWYGISFFIPKNFPIEDKPLILAEWWSNPKWKLGEGNKSPALAIRFEKGRLYVTVRNTEQRIVTEPDKVPIKIIFEQSQFKLGEWNDFVFHVKWSCKEDGLVDLWLNRTQVAKYRGGVGYNDDEGPTFKFGIRRDKTVKTYVTYASEYRRGDSYKEVEPTRPKLDEYFATPPLEEH